MNTTPRLQAGAAQVDITPTRPCFLYGYPHVPRLSTSVSDPLLASALYLTDGKTGAFFIGNDVIFVPKSLVDRARRRIEKATGVPADHVMISATHTHSGPLTTRMVSNESDPVIPQPDPDYLRQLEDGIVAAGERAYADARPAEVGFGTADGSMLGGNRHDPQGVNDPHVSVLAVRSVGDRSFISLMLVCCMHPTVLHEDSTAISGDFPGFARRFLQHRVVHPRCPVVYHMGAAGNQSPRHVTRSNTLAEAQRLGEELGESIVETLAALHYRNDVAITCVHRLLDLPLREFPPTTEAESARHRAKRRFEHLRDSGAPRPEVRSAECDWFGAEETATLALAADSGRLKEAASSCMPARVQVIRVGPWPFVGWPGEVFVEFGLEIRRRFEGSSVITLANGDLEGYLVTREAVERNTYESGNALFLSPDSGGMLVEATIELLDRLDG